MTNVVDNSGPEEHTLVVRVLVTDQTGAPVEGVRVWLQDGGSGPFGDTEHDPSVARQLREGLTDTDGWVEFLEGVGPPPCNNLWIGLADRPQETERHLGCLNGGPVPSPFTEEYQIDVFRPERVQIVSCGTPDDSVMVGDSIDLRATVENPNNQRVNFDLEWRLGGRRIAQTQASIRGSATESIITTATVDQAGTDTLEVFLNNVAQAG